MNYSKRTMTCTIISLMICALIYTSIHSMNYYNKQIEIAHIVQTNRSLVHKLYLEPNIYYVNDGRYYTLDTIAEYEREGKMPVNDRNTIYAKQQACDLLYDACLPLRTSELDHCMRATAWNRHRRNGIRICPLQCILNAEETARTKLPTLFNNCNSTNNLAEEMIAYLNNLTLTL